MAVAANRLRHFDQALLNYKCTILQQLYKVGNFTLQSAQAGLSLLAFAPV